MRNLLTKKLLLMSFGFVRRVAGYPVKLLESLGKPLKQYKIYGNSKQGELPSEYTQVEYIESTGTQCIDTGISGDNNNLSFEVKYEWTELPSTGKYAYILGNHINEDSNTTRLLQYGNNITYLNLNTKAQNGTTQYRMNRTVNTIYEDKLSNSKYETNSNYINITNKTKGISNKNNVFIFSKGLNNTTTFSKIKLYSFKIYDNDILIRNFIPCYRKSNNVIGMYDIVNNVFYTNAGTGTFIAGAKILNPDNPIEIQSVGDKTNNLYGGQSEYTLSKVTNDTHMSFYKAFEIGKTYTLFCYIDNTQGTAKAQFRMSVGTTTGWKYLSSNSVATGKEGYSRVIITIPENYNNNLNMQYQVNGGTATFKDIMLVEGSYNVNNLPTYEPYGYKIPVNINRGNLYDKNTIKNGFVPISGTYPTQNSTYPNAQYQTIKLDGGKPIILQHQLKEMEELDMPTH